MGDWAERMIIEGLQEESKIRQERIALRNKIAQEKIRKANTLVLSLFPYRNIYGEWFWNFIAYTYFICKTLGLFILIDLFIFGGKNIILLIFILLGCFYLNLKLYKYISGKKSKEIQGNIF